MRSLPLLLSILIVLAGPVGADEGEALLGAARSGDVALLVELLDAGAEIDSTGPYGNSALIVAATQGHDEVVRLLLERGADAEHKEAFYGAGALDMALFNGHPETARILLENGSDGRETAFAAAIRSADLELARAAVESGPFLESMLESLRAMPMLGAKFKEMLATIESRPDPEPPVYGATDLERYVGRFEGWDSAVETVVSLEQGSLRISLGGEDPVTLSVFGEHTFRAADGDLQVAFWGRSGTIEGVAISSAGAAPQSMRRSVARVVEGAAARVETPTEPLRASTVNWPRFRGSNADGIGDGRDTPIAWDLELGSGVLWQRDLPGLGNSSPIVWGDKVFVTTAVADGIDQTIRTGLTGDGGRVEEAVAHSWRVLAFDKSSGEPLWSTDVGTGVPLTQRHFKATQANSTPVTDGRYVVAVFPTAGLACLDLEGKLLWKHDLGGLNAGAFSDPGVEWGFASSPIIYGSTVILQVDVHEGQYLAAWDLASGEEVWRTARQVAPSWATPTLLSGPAGDELVVNGSTIYGYDPATGRELWSLGPNSELVIAAPVVGDGVVYVSAGYPPIKPIYALRAGTRGEVSAEPGKTHDRLVWSHSPGGAYMPTPLLYGGLFYLVHHNGRIVAYDAATGDAVYKRRFSQGGVFTGSPVAVNGKLYLPTEEGMMYVLAAGPEYSELAINEFGEPLMATPAVSDGILLVRTPSRLIALAKVPVRP